MKFDIVIQTKPVPQARPRFFIRHHGLKHFVGAYDPAKCKTFKEVVAWHAKIKAIETGLRQPCQDPIELEIIFQMGKWNGGSHYHTKRPDLDNLVKSVKDALTGVIWKDDAQIIRLTAEKRYGQEMVVISVMSVEETTQTSILAKTSIDTGLVSQAQVVG
jgi:Holliday junction resolvase RusA-like endonuclease